jgi:hypothetical protein
MIDQSLLISWISPVITAMATYIKTQGVQKAADKAMEVIGEKAVENTVGKGQKALTLLHSQFFAKADAKAKQALANMEQNPDDENYQQELIKETARLASIDSAFAQELRLLAEKEVVAQPGSVIIHNDAPSYGAQGVFSAPVHFDNRTIKDTP